MKSSSLNLLRQVGAVLVVPVVVLGLGACSEKSDTRQASDWLAKGLVAHQAGRIDEAVTAYERVVEHNPRNQYGFFNLGVVASSRGDKVTAENNYRLALSIDPDFEPALFNLAVVRNGAGDKTGAEALYRRVIEVNATNPQAHLNLGFLLRDMDRSTEGDQELAEAVRLDPSLASRIPAVPAEPEPAPTTAAKTTK